MAYLGRGLDKISNIEVLDNITFDGSSSYSITKGSVAFTPNSAQSLLISIDGVVQATNFSVNSSTIDFGVAIPSTSVCNFFLHYGTGVMTVPSDGSVTTAKLGSNAVTTAKITDANVTSAKMFSGFANGITEADQWRLTANTNNGTNADITTNWERNDSSGYSSIGTGLTESSGIFSFSQTGIYLIKHTAYFNIASGDSGTAMDMYITENNSSYIKTTRAISGTGGTGVGGSGSQSFIFDVTDITTHKFKFATDTFNSGTYLLGNTSFNTTSITVLRLGDT